jgi:uncharacterized protein (TIGR02588 family)
MTRLDKNVLEWTVFGVALVLVLATFGYLVRESLSTRDGPPDVVVTLGEPRTASGGHMVEVTAENRGGATAEEVQIAVRLESGGGEEEAVLLLPYLPRESRRSGWVTFRGDPRTGLLRVAGVAFQAP